jgi:hypothetical protein
MTTTDKPRLAYGLNDAIPEAHQHAVWGARLIFPDDLVWDRQDTINYGGLPDDQYALDRDLLTNWLNGTRDGYYPTTRGESPLDQALRAAKRLLRADQDENVVLYEDGIGQIIGNPRASFGYVYLVAYLRYGRAG